MKPRTRLSGLTPQSLGIPLADAATLRPAAARTRLTRVGLAVALVGLLALALVEARSLPVQHSSFFPAGGSGILVIDFSNSIALPAYRRITNVLTPVVDANQPIGVVYFSDVAYEALPPATPGRELRPFLRYLKTPQQRTELVSQRFRDSLAAFEPPQNPWAAAFRGGTRISKGLDVARAAIKRDRIRDATVLLVSDLDDSLFDLPALADTLATYKREGLNLRIVPLFPAPEDRAYFRETLGPGAFVSHAELLENGRSTERESLEAGFPLALLVIGVALILAVAVSEARLGRLDWRRPA